MCRGKSVMIRQICTVCDRKLHFTPGREIIALHCCIV